MSEYDPWAARKRYQALLVKHATTYRGLPEWARVGVSDRELEERREHEREEERKRERAALLGRVVELFLDILAVVTRAWAERYRDGTSMRFALLELS